jgi:hypothetical protein
MIPWLPIKTMCAVDSLRRQREKRVLTARP